MVITDLALAPAWLLEMLQRAQEVTGPAREGGQGCQIGLLPCAVSFIREGTKKGTRDICLFTLAKHCRKVGIVQKEAVATLKQANAACIPPLPEDELNVKVKSAYGVDSGKGFTSLGCDEGAWKPYCVGKEACPVYNPNERPWPEPEPIKNTLRPVDTLPLDIIPKPLQAWLADISHRMQCPLDFVAVGSITEAGAIVGAGCGIRPKKKDDWRITPNLWGGVIARPSMLKTPALAEALKPMGRLEAEARETYEEGLAFYEADKEVHKAQKDALKAEMLTVAKGRGQKTMNDVKSNYTNLEAPEEPIWRRYKTNDATVEKVGELLNQNPRGLLIFRDELVGLLTSWDREDRHTDRAFYLEAWNGFGSFTTDRIGRGTTHCKNLCISILGGIQPSKLTAYLYQAKSDLQNDGLLQRFQLLVYPDEPKKWALVDECPDEEAKNRAFNIFKSLADMSFTEYGAELPDGDHIPYFHFSEDAQIVFNEWLTGLQFSLQDEETPLMVEHLSKYRSLMPSLALIFHLISIADGQAGGPVSSLAAQQAADWCGYLESHARRIYGLVADVSIRAAGELAQKIKKGSVQDGFTLRDVYRNCWHLLDKKELVKEACSELIEAGWLRECVSERGKTKPVYTINPKIFL